MSTTLNQAGEMFKGRLVVRMKDAGLLGVIRVVTCTGVR